MSKSERLEAAVGVPAIVTVPKGAKTVELEAILELHNRGEDNYLVAASTENEVQAWQVLDDQGREVARSPRAKRTRQRDLGGVVSRLVVAGHRLLQPAALSLPASKLRDGQTFTVRAEFWDYTAEAEFTAVHETVELTPLRPAGAAKRAGTRRGAPKRPAAAKRAAAPKAGAPAKRAASKRAAAKGAAATGPAASSAPAKAARPAVKAAASRGAAAPAPAPATPVGKSKKAAAGTKKGGKKGKKKKSGGKKGKK